MTVSGFAEITLEARDPEALASFHRDAFGLAEISREPDRTWLAVGPGARLGVWNPGEEGFGDEGGRHVHRALAVEPWDFFERGSGGRDGVAALREG
ncbi:MAG TPA: VOC family protein [Solirubrobacterales bacterium]|nr:VOC family protein [Solirubrobacterales bacterium]